MRGESDSNFESDSKQKDQEVLTENSAAGGGIEAGCEKSQIRQHFSEKKHIAENSAETKTAEEQLFQDPAHTADVSAENSEFGLAFDSDSLTAKEKTSPSQAQSQENFAKMPEVKDSADEAIFETSAKQQNVGDAENFRNAGLKRMFSGEKAKKTKKYSLVVIAVLLLAAAVYGSVNGIDYLLHGKKAYAITVDDEQIATVNNYRTANSVIKDYLSGDYNSTKIKDAHFTDDVKITKVYQPKQEILDYDRAQDKLAEKANAVAKCVTIEADGIKLISLSDEDEAKEALRQLKDSYAPDDSNLEVTDVKFKENVQIVEDTADVADILPAEDAVCEMQKLTETQSYVYTVQKGDTLEAVCESQGVSAENMTKLDDDIDFENLHEGDRLQIDKEKSLINVLTVMQETKQEIIAYDISYRENDEMPAGTQNVVQEGFDGAEIVDLKIVRINDKELYRERLSAETTIQSTTKVVDCGTKVYRGNGETGKANITSVNQMIWPTNATAISSPYGIRSSGFHTGLDINGETGDPVWAALSGTVTTAGWAGNYGNCIVVKHSDGLSTRYAHLSAINVGVGEKVTQGQTIGLEGSTGNSTGSHLHFEVIIGGAAVDPLIYISR